MSQVKERVEAGNVSLYPGDWAIIDAADTGDAGRSATLRRIVREWAAMHQPARTLIDTPAPYRTEPVAEETRRANPTSGRATPAAQSAETGRQVR